MSTYKTATEYHVWFESLAEMEAEMPGMIKQRNSRTWETQVTSNYAGTSWFGCSSATEAMEKVREGWPELVAKLQPMIVKLRKRLDINSAASVQVEVRRRKRHRSDHGDTLDITRVWNGQLDTAWERPVKVPRLSQTQRYVSIFVDGAVNCMVTSDQTLWRTAAAMCMIDVLTSMGINTEVWSGATSTTVWVGGPGRSFSGIRVKEYTQPINEDRLSSMLSVGFFRTWLFGSMMAAPWVCTHNMGYPRNADLPKPLRDRREKGERVVRMGTCLSEDGAVSEVQTLINSLKEIKGEAA